METTLNASLARAGALQRLRPIDTEFTYHGHYLRQIWRTREIAVYERSVSPEHPPHELELIVIKVQPEGTLPNGTVVPEREAYPSVSKWGQIAWSFPVRYKTWVMALSEKLSAFKKNYGVMVRQAITAYKQTTDFRKATLEAEDQE